MFGFGIQELVLILIIVVVLFGASRVPQLMRGIGTGIKEFKSALKDDQPAPGQEETPAKKPGENSER
jgi:sec-independent protein translocase protein TatA